MPSASQPCDRCWSSSSSARDIVGVWQLTCERHAIPTGVSGSAAGVNETPTSEPQMKNIQRRVASHQVLRVASHIHHGKPRRIAIQLSRLIPTDPPTRHIE